MQAKHLHNGTWCHWWTCMQHDFWPCWTTGTNFISYYAQSLTLHIHSISKIPAILHCDNQGNLQGCENETKHHIWHHRQASMDQYMEFWAQRKTTDIQQEWVKGHQDAGTPWENIETLQHIPPRTCGKTKHSMWLHGEQKSATWLFW